MPAPGRGPPAIRAGGRRTRGSRVPTFGGRRSGRRRELPRRGGGRCGRGGPWRDGRVPGSRPRQDPPDRPARAAGSSFPPHSGRGARAPPSSVPEAKPGTGLLWCRSFARAPRPRAPSRRRSPRAAPPPVSGRGPSQHPAVPLPLRQEKLALRQVDCPFVLRRTAAHVSEALLQDLVVDARDPVGGLAEPSSQRLVVDLIQVPIAEGRLLPPVGG